MARMPQVGGSDPQGGPKMYKTLWRDEEGLTNVEYALLLALVAIAAVTAWTTLGNRISTTVTSVSGKMPAS